MFFQSADWTDRILFVVDALGNSSGDLVLELASYASSTSMFKYWAELWLKESKKWYLGMWSLSWGLNNKSSALKRESGSACLFLIHRSLSQLTYVSHNLMSCSTKPLNNHETKSRSCSFQQKCIQYPKRLIMRPQNRNTKIRLNVCLILNQHLFWNDLQFRNPDILGFSHIYGSGKFESN